MKFFSRNAKKADGLQTTCKDCNRTYSAKWYQRNRTSHIQAAKKIKEQRIIAATAFIADYLMRHPCVDCREDDILVLDFDHVRGKKDCNISHMVANGYRIQRIKDEIKKCKVRCANCHRRKTARTQGWRRLLHAAARTG